MFNAVAVLNGDTVFKNGTGVAHGLGLDMQGGRLTGAAAMTIRDALTSYLLGHDLAQGSAGHLRQAVENFCRWAGNDSLESLQDDSINRWLAALLDEGYARRTVRGMRTSLLTIWRYAWEEGNLPSPPRLVRKVVVPQTLPEAWSLHQLQALLAAAEKMGGKFGRYGRIGVKRSSYWRAFVLTAYDSGLRLADLERIRREQISSGGALAMTQQKTGWPILCKLRPETLAAIEATFPPEREYVFKVLSRQHFFLNWSALLYQAGLKGGTRKLRRTSATWVEAIAPGSAMAHLGHKTPGLAYRHYVDPRHLGGDKPMPPPIAG